MRQRRNFRSVRAFHTYVERFGGRGRRVSFSKRHGYYYQAINKNGVIVGAFFTGGTIGKASGWCNLECKR